MFSSSHKFPTKSQSRSYSQSPQQTQQSQPLYPWSAHTHPSGQWSSPFPRDFHALSTTATATGELFLFGGYVHTSMSPSNDLYVISARDFSTTLLQTSGDVPSPRYGHRAVLTSTTLLIWGGTADDSDYNAQNESDDDSVYLLNLVSREWTRIMVDGPGPGRRFYHTMTLVGSKLFIFGGRTTKRRLNDIWALDLNCLKSNPFWESYEPAPGDEKPLPRSGHVSVTIGDRIIIFGGFTGQHRFNDTWSFNIRTRKWTELQCTGPIPFPRSGHAAVLIDDVMYVFGGFAPNGTILGDLTALNLLTQRWTVFQAMGPSPCRRYGHAMACDGTRVFVLGGESSPGARVDEDKLIHVLDTNLLIFPKPDFNTVKHEKTTQLALKLSIQGQPHRPSSSCLDAHATNGASPFQKATPEELDHPTSQGIAPGPERNPSLNDLPSRPTGASGRPRRISEEGDGGEGSMEHHATLMGPGAPSGKEITWSDHGRLVELDRQLSGTLVAKTEWDRCIAQLTDELALKSALLDQAEANAAEEKRRAGLELRKVEAKLDESLRSRNHALEQAQIALHKASCAAKANEQSQRELTEIRAELEASKSELVACRLQLADTENGRAKSKAEADTSRTRTATDVNTDEDRVVHRLMERMQAMEAEMASLRWNEKSFEMMETRNEG